MLVSANSAVRNGAQEARSAFDAISYALRSNAAAAACKAALPVPGSDRAADPPILAADALSTLQARQACASLLKDHT